jgi:GST-like protein
MIDVYSMATPNGHKVHIMLEECGLPYRAHNIDIGEGDQFKPEFLAISPNNKIPAIVDPNGPDGKPFSVFESGAILIYLASKVDKFLGQTDREKFTVLQWLMFQMAGFGPMPGQVHHFLGLANEDDKRYGLARYMKETRRLYGVMDQRLASHTFFAGEISIADFAILGWAWRHQRHQVDLNDFPNVKRWYDTMMARPAVQRGFTVALK